MKYRFIDESVGTEYFLDASLGMDRFYDPPGVEVQRDEDGVPYFSVRQELSDRFDADDRFEQYGESDQNMETEEDDTE